VNISSMTYKKKFRFLIVGIALSLLLSYSLAIKKTVKYYRDCCAMELNLDMIVEAPQNINELNKKITQIDELISTGDTSEDDFRQTLLEKTGNFCVMNNITLKEFPASVHTIKNDYQIETNTIVLEGTFISILKYIYMLEQKCKIGKVISADFSTKFDLSAKKNKLSCKIYLQNIKKQKNEN
jgi:hypothetical protein